MSKFVIVNFSFNSPEIRIIGPVKESTIEKLNDILPDATSSMRGTRGAAPSFTYLSNPNHWYVKLEGQFCDEFGVSHLMQLVIDALDKEGQWKLTASHALAVENTGSIQQDCTETYKLFFTSKTIEAQ